MIKLPNFGTIVKTILDAGTFTNYLALSSKHKAPKTFVTRRIQGSRHGMNVWIDIVPGNEDPIQAFDSTVIEETLKGAITANARNEADRDALKTDIQNILAASAYSYKYTGGPIPDIRNRYTKTFNLAIMC